MLKGPYSAETWLRRPQSLLFAYWRSLSTRSRMCALLLMLVGSAAGFKGIFAKK
ncbi:hypothetical protein BDV29DRAFT_142234 [Aspergillus leporis]|uniref:Uncharacterized protein n=1 Tax=Aspergillus leporis TaxID=41062 RepID=A0A5N5WWS4_9EURO|nr:hypothetical protein BDV29DRAFT_142234 [Aspergillus leporis]